MPIVFYYTIFVYESYKINMRVSHVSLQLDFDFFSAEFPRILNPNFDKTEIDNFMIVYIYFFI